MKSKVLLLALPTLLAACTTAPSSGVPTIADKFLTPTVVAYTKEEQAKAADEMAANCQDRTPMLCRMTVDYGKMRDSARTLQGKKVDTAR